METIGDTNGSVVTENRPVWPGDGGRQAGIRERVSEEPEETLGVMVMTPI